MQGQKKTHQIQEPMKKGKFAQHVFHNFRQAEAANEFADFPAYAGTYAKRSTRDFFQEHLNSETLSQSSRN